MHFAPTQEQLDALAKFESGKSLAIEAGAGTGKTATLKLLAESTTRRGQYVAFNKAIVTEAGQKMPRTVACNTAHSLAMRAVGHRYRHRLDSNRMRSIEIANRLGVTELSIISFDDSRKTLSRSFLAGLTMRAIGRFCQTADQLPSRKHVPWVEGVDAPRGDRAATRTNNDAIARHIEAAMIRAWDDLSNTQGALPFRHDHYLKLWQLSGPRIEADYILFDEAQDANPVMVAVVAAQTHAQLVWVGDSQQEIYAFTGAVNALASVPSEHRAFLTQSFRFGPAIAEQANTILAMIPSAELRLTGTPTIDSKIEPVERPRCILTRTNAEAVRCVLDAKQNELRPHLVGGGREIAAFARAAEKLQRGEHVEHPELACFDDWSEVQEYVDHDEQGAELRLMVKLVDDFGTAVILGAIERMPSEEDADLIVSTAHKSKGREWDSVQLAPDFTITRDGEQQIREGDEERRLLYVAVTRARLILDLSALPALAGDQAVEQADGAEEAGESDPQAVSRVISQGNAILARMIIGGLFDTPGVEEAALEAELVEDAERRMQELEAQGDREGTIRDEIAKHEARARMEARA